MYDKTLIGKRAILKAISYDVLSNLNKTSWPLMLHDAISKMKYAFPNSLQPCVPELQEWYVENSDTKDYHDNQHEAQASLLLDFVDVDKYFPSTCINKPIKTDYFKSHQRVFLY